MRCESPPGEGERKILGLMGHGQGIPADWFLFLNALSLNSGC